MSVPDGGRVALTLGLCVTGETLAVPVPAGVSVAVGFTVLVSLPVWMSAGVTVTVAVVVGVSAGVTVRVRVVLAGVMVPATASTSSIPGERWLRWG